MRLSILPGTAGMPSFTDRQMPDAIFDEPRLAAIYDPACARIGNRHLRPGLLPPPMCV
jgi:hypothetical protein